MNQAQESANGTTGDEGQASPPVVSLAAALGSAARAVVVLTVLTGVVFPLALAAGARVLFPYQSDGSLLRRDGVVVGSELIGQGGSDPGYFHPRPSAAGDGYDGVASGSTNLGPGNPKLRDEARELARRYRERNNLPEDTTLPADAVTRSGSGLDPHISPANAALQVPRVAQARGVSEERVRALVVEHTRGRQAGVLGEPRVGVLELNLALDAAASRR